MFKDKCFFPEQQQCFLSLNNRIFSFRIQCVYFCVRPDGGRKELHHDGQTGARTGRDHTTSMFCSTHLECFCHYMDRIWWIILFLCVQLCEDLFQRTGENNDPDLTYSVEVNSLSSIHFNSFKWRYDRLNAVVSSTSRCPTWRSTASGFEICWTQVHRGLCGFGSIPSSGHMWRICPNSPWPDSPTSGIWWTPATKLGQSSSRGLMPRYIIQTDKCSAGNLCVFIVNDKK